MAIDDADTEQPAFRRLEQLAFTDHLQPLEISTISASTEEESDVVERAVEHVLNLPFSDVCKTPPWRLFVLPLAPAVTHPQTERFLLVYNYSHSHGDGLSGLAFHKTLFQALSMPDTSANKATTTLQTTDAALPGVCEPLPISWTYLLGAIVNEFLPWLSRLRFWGPAAPPTPWTGAPTLFDEHSFRTAAQLINIPQREVLTASRVFKPHGIKLTAILHLVIVRALTVELRRNNIEANSFSSGTPTDLRKLFGLSPTQMGVNASAVAQRHEAFSANDSINEVQLSASRELTVKLAHATSTRHDQIIGLLKYATPLRKWHLDKMSKPRGTSYELSNIMTFDPVSADHSTTQMKAIFFAQPADAGGPALTFNVVSLKSGDMSINVSWQVGALGLFARKRSIEEVEREFVARVAATLKKDFINLPGLDLHPI